jgi:hypothetical protein
VTGDAQTHNAIVQILNRVLNASFDDPVISKPYAEMGRTEFAGDQRTPAAHKACLDAEIDWVGKFLRNAGITPDP